MYMSWAYVRNALLETNFLPEPSSLLFPLLLLRPGRLRVFPELGNLVARVNLGCQVHLLILLCDIVLLQELGTLDLPLGCQELQIPLYAESSAIGHPALLLTQLTSQMSAVLQMVHTLAGVAFVQFLASESKHHGADPLLANDGIFGGLEGLGIVVVHSVEGRRDLRLHALEALGLGSRHDDGLF